MKTELKSKSSINVMGAIMREWMGQYYLDDCKKRVETERKNVKWLIVGTKREKGGKSMRVHFEKEKMVVWWLDKAMWKEKDKELKMGVLWAVVRGDMYG